MKKALIFILAIIFLFAGCAPKLQESEYGEIEENALVDFAVSQADGESVIAELINQTDMEMVYGKQYTLEKLDGDKWYVVPYKQGIAFEDIGIILKANETGSVEFKLSEHFNALENGDYRIILDLYVSDPASSITKVTVSAEFFI